LAVRHCTTSFSAWREELPAPDEGTLAHGVKDHIIAIRAGHKVRAVIVNDVVGPERLDTTGRTARLIEFDPAYCDAILRRFEGLTGKEAKLATTGEGLKMWNKCAARRRCSRENGRDQDQNRLADIKL
jgi:hypothetical protein